MLIFFSFFPLHPHDAPLQFQSNKCIACWIIGSISVTMFFEDKSCIVYRNVKVREIALFNSHVLLHHSFPKMCALFGQFWQIKGVQANQRNNTCNLWRIHVGKRPRQTMVYRYSKRRALSTVITRMNYLQQDIPIHSS